MNAEKCFKQYLEAAGFRCVDKGKLTLKQYYVELVMGGRTYNFADHYVNFSENGSHLSTFCYSR